MENNWKQFVAYALEGMNNSRVTYVAQQEQPINAQGDTLYVNIFGLALVGKSNVGIAELFSQSGAAFNLGYSLNLSQEQVQNLKLLSALKDNPKDVLSDFDKLCEQAQTAAKKKVST